MEDVALVVFGFHLIVLVWVFLWLVIRSILKSDE